jgi:hypothetical protein
MAANIRRPLDRATVAKLSDARERLHGLVTRAAATLPAQPEAFSWARDLNAPDAGAGKETSRE